MASSINAQSTALYRFGAFELDAYANVLSVDGQICALAPKAVQLLRELVRQGGRVVTKDELMERLWPGGFVEEGNLTQYVYVLRRVLASHGLSNAIENVPRRGYRFTAHATGIPFDSHAAGRRAARRGRATPVMFAAAAVAGAALWLLLSPASSKLDAQTSRAYELGRYYWALRTPVALQRARGYFTDVVRHVPRSALGYSGLADTYTEMYDYVCDDKPCPGITSSARRYARLAVATDGKSAEAHTSLAMTLRLFAHDDAAARTEFERALALDPKYALAHEWYGNLLLAHADMAGARKELEAAANLQPVSPATFAWLARDAYYSRRYSESVAYAREALAITPNRFESIVTLGLALQQQHRYAQAIETFERLRHMGVACDGANGMIAGVYAAQGLRNRADPLLKRQLRSCEPRRYVVLDQATASIALRRFSNALVWLHRLPLEDRMQRAFLAMDPRLDPVRADRRFYHWTTLP